MFSTPRIHPSKFGFHMSLYVRYTIVTSNFVLLSPIWMTLYVQYTKNPTVIKWLSFELICAAYLEYIVTSNFVPHFIDLICSVHQKSTVKKISSIWAYMCSILRVYNNLLLCPIVLNFTDPIWRKVGSIWPYICRIHSNLGQIILK